jgi:LysM repeat protein
MYYLKVFKIIELNGSLIQDRSFMFWVPLNNYMRNRRPLCIKVLLLIVLFLFCYGCQKKDYAESVDAIEARLAMIEQRITQLEKMEQRISAYEFQLKALQESFARLNSIVTEIHEASQTNRDQSATHRKGSYYRVERGDSLYGIAQKYGLTVEELHRLNNLNKGHVIYPGQRLLVNSKSVQ